MATKNKKYKNMDRQEYNTIKGLIGLLGDSKTGAEIAQIVKRSQPTISYIKRSDNYEDNRRIIAEMIAKAKAKEQAAEQAEIAEKVVAPVAPPQAQDKQDEIVEAMIEALKGIQGSLTAINDKLDMVAVPKRRFGL